MNAVFADGCIEEQVYPVKPYFYKLDASSFWDKIKDMNAKYVEKIRPNFVRKHPNTHSFSMALSENIIWDQRHLLKHAAIVRPSCLSSSYTEPEQGMFDGLQLPTSIMSLHAMGITRAVDEDVNKVLPIIPTDTLVNGIISVAWFMSSQADNSCLIYNVSTEAHNGVTVGQIQRYATDSFDKYPSSKAIRLPVEPKAQNRIVYKFNQIVSETLFAYFFDLLLICIGRSPMLVDMISKMHSSMKEVSSYYFRKSYNFTVSNLKTLIEAMNDEDKQTFDCNIDNINWSQYFDDCYMRYRRHILKEPDSNVSDSIKRIHK